MSVLEVTSTHSSVLVVSLVTRKCNRPGRIKLMNGVS